MKHFLSLLLFVLMLSCTDNESDNRYTQFTSDDLSFLYFNSDTLVFIGDTIQLVDTISFMFNGSEIVKVPVETIIESLYNPFYPNGKGLGIHGESTLKLKKESGFRFVYVRLSREVNYDIGSYKVFSVGVDGKSSFSKGFDKYDQITLDTALVLGVHYENVIKFEPDSLSLTNIKSIYFAKKFGFIRIETLDGKTMERVLPVI